MELEGIQGGEAPIHPPSPGVRRGRIRGCTGIMMMPACLPATSGTRARGPASGAGHRSAAHGTAWHGMARHGMLPASRAAFVWVVYAGARVLVRVCVRAHVSVRARAHAMRCTAAPMRTRSLEHARARTPRLASPQRRSIRRPPRACRASSCPPCFGGDPTPPPHATRCTPSTASRPSSPPSSSWCHPSPPPAQARVSPVGRPGADTWARIAHGGGAPAEGDDVRPRRQRGLPREGRGGGRSG
jgi:hypothetical protein